VIIRSLYLTACSSLIGLIFLCLAWELRLAPVQTGGSWLALKCLPLLAPLFGILNGRRYSYQWASMLILLYFTEGVVRATTEKGLSPMAGSCRNRPLAGLLLRSGWLRQAEPSSGEMSQENDQPSPRHSQRIRVKRRPVGRHGRETATCSRH
jgi:hypothetical protein